MDLADGGNTRLMIENALARCLAGRPGEDLVAMSLRLPENECNDALRAALNDDGVQRGHLARREAHIGVARTDITIQDMPSGMPLASIEAKAVTSQDAVAAGFQSWVAPKVAGDVAKLNKQNVGQRFFVVWKTHWFWMARPEMYAYPKLLRSTPTTKQGRLSSEAISAEVRQSHEAIKAAMESGGVRDVAAHIIASGEHSDLGAVLLTAHLGEV